MSPTNDTEGNKYSTLKLANVNRQANTVKDLKQKPKKSRLSTKRDNNLQKNVPSSENNERKLSLRRKNEKNTLSKESERFCRTQVDQTRKKEFEMNEARYQIQSKK